MHFTQFGVAAALAGVGSALLLPPIISSVDAEDLTLPFDNVDGRVMEVNCPGCPVTVTDVHNQAHQIETENILKLNFSVAHGATDQLLLNGVQIYPTNTASMPPLTAPQLVKSQEDTWQVAAEPRLGFAFSVQHGVHFEGENIDLVKIHLRIVAVMDTMVDGIPAVELGILETPSGKLMFGNAKLPIPQGHVPVPTLHADEKCNTLVCKWRAIIADKFSKIKGCGRKGRPTAIAAMPRPHGRPSYRPHGARPHHPNRPFRHHHHRHSFSRFAKIIALHVLLPIFVGIAVGITASLVGMIVGNLIVFVWRAIRGGRPQYASVEQEEEAVEDCEDETKAFIEPPPMYEAVDDKADQ